MKNKKNRKIFVLDTSVLVYDPSAFKFFNGNNVVIPLVVLEELDKVKSQPNENGRNARVAIRFIDDISNTGQINSGIEIDNDVILKVEVSDFDKIGSDPKYGDNKILSCALKLNKDDEVILVSKDINLRIKAKSYGLKAEDYNRDRIGDGLDLYCGIQKINNEAMGATLLSEGEIYSEEFKEVGSLYPNECLMILSDDGKLIGMGRKTKDIVKIIKSDEPWGLSARNAEQQMAIDMIMDPKIPLVSILGTAGSGKSLISLACGLELVLNKRKYESFCIYKPFQSVGDSVGYLPGELSEKASPWFASIDDGFQFLFTGNARKKNSWKEQLFQYINNGTIKKEVISFIRGRNIINSLILIDEAQNLTREEIKTIITRVGPGSKIICNGDLTQIDAPKLDATSSGFSYLIDKFKKSNLSGHITFTKGERSALATEAAEIL